MRALLTCALLASMPAAGWAQEPAPQPPPPTVEQRIDEGAAPAGGSNPLPSPPPALPPVESVTIAPDPLLRLPDASLAQPTGPTRLQTPLDGGPIGQRIDKGLTAAGERSAIQPDYAFGAFQRGYFLTAFSLALNRAQTGDAAAQTLLGELLSRGLGVKQDLAAAADWYGLAGKSGDPEALYALGRFHLEGVGVKQDDVRAAELFEQAAKAGHGAAARELGYLLLQGRGREKNAMLAAAYMRRAAAQGDMDAQFTLAGLYVEGVGVVGDEGQAARWFAEAARNGHVGAQIEYAIMLFNGRGVAKDEAVAARWLREAAATDNPLAQVRLARLLADGRGVDKDPAEAARWYLVAKDRGVQDDFLDDWLTRLDQPTRQAAEEAAARWTRLRGGWRQAAVEAPGSPNPAAPVDKTTQ